VSWSALGVVGKASVRGLPHVGCFGCEARVPWVRVVGGVVRERGCVLLPDGLVPCVLCARVCLHLFSVGGGSRHYLPSGVLVGWWVGRLVLGPAALAPFAPGVSR